MLESDRDYTPVPGEWIVRRIEYLLAELRERDRHFAALTPGRFLDPFPVYGCVRRGWYDQAVNLICAKYGLEAGRVALQWVDEIQADRTAAHVRCEQFGRVEITILAGYRADAEGFGTVLAHELGHAYLTDMGIPNGGGWEEEATTDLVTFVKGLGKLTVNGVDHLGAGQRAGSRCYGYLNREANVFAYAFVAEHFRVPRAQRDQGLNSAVRSYLETLESGGRRSGCLVGGLLGAPRPPRRAVDMELTVDDEGNVVERPPS